MNEGLTRTQTIQMVGDHVHDLRRKLESTDSSVIDLGKAMVAVQKDTAHIKESTDKLNKTLDKLSSVIDSHNDNLKKDILSLKLWRNLATGGFLVLTGLCTYFREVIGSFLTAPKN